MDIRKLQRAIVDGLEDVKAQDILVFNTEHLSPLFERVIVASGQSNRQTKALAASVRDAVKSKGLSVLRVEGEENGEWIIVDCGAAVAHIMQPSIRDYYRLEEIWGGKPVKIKLADHRGGLLPKASEGFDDDDDEDAAPATKAPKKAAVKAPAKKAAAKKAPAKAAGGKPSPAAKSAAKAAPAKKSAARKTAGTGAPAGKTARSAGKPDRTGAASPRAASVKKIVVPASTASGAAGPARKAAPAKKAAAPRKPAARRG